MVFVTQKTQNGSNQRQLTSPMGLGASPVWSPAVAASCSSRTGGSGRSTLTAAIGVLFPSAAESSSTPLGPKMDGRSSSSRATAYSCASIPGRPRKQARPLVSDASWPIVSPDGRFVAFVDFRSDVLGLSVLNLMTGETRQVAKDIVGTSPASPSPSDRVTGRMQMPSREFLIVEGSGDSRRSLNPNQASGFPWMAGVSPAPSFGLDRHVPAIRRRRSDMTRSSAPAEKEE